MTAVAFTALFAFVDIILFMAADALELQFFFIKIAPVTLVAGRFLVFAKQGEFGFIVIKFLLLP